MIAENNGSGFLNIFYNLKKKLVFNQLFFYLNKKLKTGKQMKHLFTSEAVSEGHPDKICDQISDSLLDLYLSRDSAAHTAIETMATANRVIIAGETRSSACISADEIENTIRQCVKKIGYDQNGFSWRNLEITNLLHCQSEDIARGVDAAGAGDQGIMFGYAKKEKGFQNEFMPLPIFFANNILKRLSQIRKSNPGCGLEPDAKSQVTVEYENGIAVGIKKIVVSSQHCENLDISDVRDIIKPCIKESLPDGWMPSDENLLINPTGRFVIGGPDGDCGLTGRKIIIDTYGGYAPHGGGAFSGKDPTKVDRSAAYMLRYLAKNVVAAGLADKCLLQISYAIGIADPLSLYIDCRNTCQVDEQRLLETLKNMVDLTPRGIIKHLDLRRPIYTPTASYGHFGRPAEENGFFSWEKTDLAGELKKCF